MPPRVGAIAVALHTPVPIVPRVVIEACPIYAASISITGVFPPVLEILPAVPDTEVTPPGETASQEGSPATKVKTSPFVPTGSAERTLDALANNRSPALYVDNPVPPLVGPIAVALQTPVAIVPNVVIEF